MRVGLLLSLVLVASASAQMPQGTPSDDALRKLAAQLGVPQGGGIPKLSEKDLELLKFLASDPQYRRQLEEALRNQPELVQKLKSDPELENKIKEQLPNLPLPNQNGPKPSPNPGGVPPGQDWKGQNPFTKGANPPPPNIAKKTNPAEQNPEYREMAKLWEQTVGPLDNTPAVKQMLIDMFSGTNPSKPGEKPFWADWDMKDGKGGSGSGFAKWLQGLNGKDAGGKPNLKLPKWLGGKAPNLSAPSVKMPTAPKMPSMGFSGFDFGSMSIAGLGSAGTALLIAVAVALLAFLLWKFAPQLGLAKARSPRPLPGLGPWPIDPRTIADRAGLILAFEYISVLLCGDGARVWNHATIAEALRDSVPAAAPFAEPLARLYALARYSPLSDQLSAEAIAEARGYLCQLAGVPTT